MSPAELTQLITANSSEVWSILLKNGLELVSQIGQKASIIPGFSDSSGTFALQRPFQVRVINIPVPTPQGIHVNTSPQMQPLWFFMQAKEVPIEPVDIWHMVPSIKKVHDAYLEQITGLAMPGQQ